MEWISGFQRALEKIEEQLEGRIDYQELARLACCSQYNFMRVFSVLSGYTLADYIRSRRLTAAGQELMETDVKIIDLALRYGYDSPESFHRAFLKFHGISPAQARREGAMLRSVSPMTLRISIEGGYDMNYRIEKKESMKYLGYRRRFSGTPGERMDQEHDFFIHTRLQQYALMGISGDCTTQYTLISNADAEGYDFWIAVPLNERLPEKYFRTIADLNPEFDRLFEIIEVPAATYAVFETDRKRYPTVDQEALRQKAVSEWLPTSGYQLADGTERSVIHWYPGSDERRDARYVELYLPIEKA